MSAHRFAMRARLLARRERSRRSPSRRCAQIDIVAAEPALGQHHRDVGRGPGRLPAAASTTMRASRGGSGRRAACGPPAVMRPSASMAPSSASSALASASARPPAADRGRRASPDRPRPNGRDRARSRRDRRPGFPAGWRLPASGLRLVPQPVADAGLGAPGAAAALVGGGARDPHGLEPRQADIGLVARHPREPAIDHDAHALDGERGLGDRGRQHDLAPAGRRRRDGAILRLRVERAVERHHVDRGSAMRSRSRVSVRRISAAPGRNTSTRRPPRRAAPQRPRRPPAARSARAVAAEIAGLDRKGAALALDHRRVAEQLCDARAVERRRHHEEVSDPRASPAARRGRARGRDRRRASARGTRRTAPPRRRRAPDRRGSAG